MKHLHKWLLLLLAVCGIAFAEEGWKDPFLWLEELNGEQAMGWVDQQNVTTLNVLQNDPGYQERYERSLKVLSSDARIPALQLYEGYAYNFWRDAKNSRGILRRTTIDSYKAGSPKWEVLLDVDKLSTAENVAWTCQDFKCDPTGQRCLISLSNGGGDTVEWREFDVKTKQFVKDGFTIPSAKSRVVWFDLNTLYVTQNWNEEDLTESGYSRVVSRWNRGEPLQNAARIYTGAKTDMQVKSDVWHSTNGKDHYLVIYRNVDFYREETYLIEDDRLVLMPTPEQIEQSGVYNNQLIFFSKQPWDYQGQSYSSGSVFAYDLDTQKVQLIFSPTSDRVAVQGVATAKWGVLVHTTEDVVAQLHRYQFKKGRWQEGAPVNLPGKGMASINFYQPTRDEVIMTYESPITPPTQFVVTGKSLEMWAAMPALFDSSGMVLEQHFATSKDGTKIPYFVVGKKSVLASASAPTHVYVYGGFQKINQINYVASAGALWFSEGGISVFPALRGGGEYGPKWHEGGMLGNKQNTFDDLYAVAQALVRDGVTTRELLSIRGGSNGGLTVGVALMQHPELFGAVVCEVPLLDMLRYTEIGAGPSWKAEYGDPGKPEERAWLAAYSPYHQVQSRTDVIYPPTFFYTAHSDDRVTPLHARKMAALMESMEQDALYYEETEGGHSSATAQASVKAKRYALVYTFLWQQIVNQQ